MSKTSSWKIPLYKVFWDEDDVQRVTEVLRSGMDWATGKYVQEFEQRTAAYVGTRFGVAMNSGTSALHAMLLALKIGSGDEVIVPSFTFIATANVVLLVGAKPVFADVEDGTFGLDPDSVVEKISRRTRAIMPIHYGGAPCQISELAKIADNHKLHLLEDAAESLGASMNGKSVGSFGKQATVSFCGNKVITTGEGGMVLTDNKQICEHLKLIRSHGRPEGEDYFASSKTTDYVELGYNWRLSNILAALGVSQLAKIEKAIKLRQDNAAKITRSLSKLKEVVPPCVPPRCRHVYQMYTIKVNGPVGTRDELQQFLTSRGIATKVYFSPVHLTGFYRSLGHRDRELPQTEELSKKVLTLPMYPRMTDQELEYITSSIKEFFQARN